MGYLDSTLGHHFNKVPIAQPIRDVPADTQLDDLPIEHPSTIDAVTGDRFGHSELLFLAPESYGKARRCTGTTLSVARVSCRIRGSYEHGFILLIAWLRIAPVSAPVRLHQTLQEIGGLASALADFLLEFSEGLD